MVHNYNPSTVETKEGKSLLVKEKPVLHRDPEHPGIHSETNITKLKISG